MTSACPVVGESDFRVIFESTPGLYLVLTRNLTIVAVTDAYTRATMTRREDIVGRNIFEAFPDNPDDPGATGVRNLRASLQVVLQERRPHTMAVQKYDIRQPTSGTFEVRYWSPVNTPVLGKDGAVRYIIHRVEDVTEFVQLKRAGSEKEFEILQRGVELRRLNEEFRATNKALAESRQKLLQKQRLEAIGQLTGGVAHDFNNLLTAIYGNLEIALRSMSPVSKPRDHVRAALRAAMRGAQLTRQLLAFGRRQALHGETVDANALLDELELLLRRAVGDAIHVVFKKEPALWPCLVDPVQLDSALLNLAVNARDAMPGGGTLTIETQRHEHRGDHPNGEEWDPGDYVAICVTDTGTGMSSAVRERVFEPFFTTKTADKGSGLGLSQVYGFVKQSGGHITIDSEEGRGTTVTIFLPRSNQTEARTNGTEPSPGVSPQTADGTPGKTVLVVEDDDEVRALLASTLSSLGYRALVASDGHEALSVLRSSERIDVLFTDIVMPRGLNGIALAKEARRQRREIKVLLTSGQPTHELADGAAEADLPLLPKPFRQQDLASELRRVLTDASADGFEYPPGEAASSRSRWYQA